MLEGSYWIWSSDGPAIGLASYSVLFGDLHLHPSSAQYVPVVLFVYVL